MRAEKDGKKKRKERETRKNEIYENCVEEAQKLRKDEGRDRAEWKNSSFNASPVKTRRYSSFWAVALKATMSC